jgi:hypothetical protein
MSQTIAVPRIGIGVNALTMVVEVLGHRTRSAIEHIGDIAAYVADVRANPKKFFSLRAF